MSFYDRIRHPQAASVAKATPVADGFERPRRHKYALLVTYRRTGEPIPTPVWFGRAGDTFYVRTGRDSAKVKRIRRNPEVLLAPCTARGKPLGPAAAGTARVVDAAEEERAERALAGHYGLGRRIYSRFFGESPADALYLGIELRGRKGRA